MSPKDYGTIVVNYQYDSWGNNIYTTDTSGVNLANINPFRYRSYYYDSETNLYYLNSRYYNPATGRFISADSQLNSGVLGNNMYIYCDNNPVNKIDSNGNVSLLKRILDKVLEIVGVDFEASTETPLQEYNSFLFSEESGIGTNANVDIGDDKPITLDITEENGERTYGIGFHYKGENLEINGHGFNVDFGKSSINASIDDWNLSGQFNYQFDENSYAYAKISTNILPEVGASIA